MSQEGGQIMEKRQWGSVLRGLGCAVILSLPVLGILFAIVNSGREKSRREQPTKEATAQQAAYDEYRKRYDETIAALARKHNAVRFEEKVRMNTLDLQEILEKTNEHPIWFIKRITDFIKEEGRYIGTDLRDPQRDIVI
jgi:hypothetical protein